MSWYDVSDLEAARTRRGLATLAVFVTVLLVAAALAHASAARSLAADRPDDGTTFPRVVSGPAAPDAPSGAALVFASLSLPSTLSGLAAGGEDRQGAPQPDQTVSIASTVPPVAPAGSDVPAAVVVASGGLALMVPPLGTAGVSLPAVPAPTVWDDLAACESHGEWDYDPATATWGNRLFDGGLQFLPATWSAFAPDGFPARAYDASREQQIAVAERVLDVQGWGAWPTCARKLGLL